MIRYGLQLNGNYFEQTCGDSGEQRILVCTVYEVAKNQTQLSD